MTFQTCLRFLDSYFYFLFMRQIGYNLKNPKPDLKTEHTWNSFTLGA